MNITLTGTKGYLIEKIKRELSKTNNVTCVSVRERVSIPMGADCVIHIAGLTPGNEKKSSDFYEINTKKTQEILDATIKVGAKKFIYFSSMAIYGNVLSRHDWKDIGLDTVIAKGNDYGTSKYYAEQYIKQRNEIAWIILRLPSLYDQEELEYFNCFISESKKRITPIFHHNTRRSLFHIDNLTELLVKLVDTNEYDRKILLPCDSYSPSSEELFQKAAKDNGINYHGSILYGFLYDFLSYLHPYFSTFSGSAKYDSNYSVCLGGKTYEDISLKT